VRAVLHWLRIATACLLLPALTVVIWGELTPSPPALTVDVWDKALHFTAYFGLAAMATIAVRADRRALWWGLGLVMLGGLLEIVQGLTGRDADIWDEVANSIGVLAGLALGWAAVALARARKLVDTEPRP
jgi:VanZ family protein